MAIADQPEILTDDRVLLPPSSSGLPFYARGSWLFFRRMWPAIYDLSTGEVYVFATSIAFNIILSFFPFIVLVGSVLVNLLNSQQSYETIYKLMRAFVPVESGVLFRSLDSVTRGPTGKAGLFSFGLLIFSSSGVFLPIELALNRAYGFVKPRGTIKQYLTYFALTIICGGVMICAGLLTAYIDSGLAAVFGRGQVRIWFFNGLALAVSFPFLTLFLFLIYYWVPHGKVEMRQIFFTSAATALLCLIATFAYRMAIPLLGLKSSYGELFKVMALITWIFILSFILILGANLSARQILPRSWTGRQPQQPTGYEIGTS